MSDNAPPAAAARVPRIYRVLACCAAVPILLGCAGLGWALPQLDPLGQGRANGAVMWPIALGLTTLGLLLGVLYSSSRRSAGCLLSPLVLGAVSCTLTLVHVLIPG